MSGSESPAETRSKDRNYRQYLVAVVRSRAGAKRGRAASLVVGVMVSVACVTEVIESALDRTPGVVGADVSRREKMMKRLVPRTPHEA